MTDQPLGLPKGSIRAILVLLVVVGALIGVYAGGVEQSNKFFDILKVLIPLYIGSRVNWDKDKE